VGFVHVVRYAGAPHFVGHVGSTGSARSYTYDDFLNSREFIGFPNGVVFVPAVRYASVLHFTAHIGPTSPSCVALSMGSCVCGIVQATWGYVV
jgi:hypothetical protein